MPATFRLYCDYICIYDRFTSSIIVAILFLASNILQYHIITLTPIAVVVDLLVNAILLDCLDCDCDSFSITFYNKIISFVKNTNCVVLQS